MGRKEERVGGASEGGGYIYIYAQGWAYFISVLLMDNAGYSKWGCDLEEAPGESWRHWGWRLLWLAVTFMIATILWGLILTIGLSKAATEHGALLGYQDLLRTNGQGTQAQLQTARTQLGEAQAKLSQQESALKELSERVTQGLAEAGRDREGIRAELLRALEAARLGNRPCEQCPASWLPFQGSCYLFSELKATWEEAQHNCTSSGAHLVIVEDLDEQAGPQGHLQSRPPATPMPHHCSHWRQGEPNDSGGREDCVMMLDTGMWNDAPCSDDERDNWICEKRQSC
ncbi:hypothetical protein HPG69_013685 [Diceros bicornis minor]|uniref:C-type lectin domain-containing protein n=1 Tax=Diceros bicornis minor TaxID=77932 RepID=A0A7J7FMV4_DICBM|nr:hypothetical protein HPG69_013685 [Diceros bicornis minor]